jgi:hypothetical protein
MTEVDDTTKSGTVGGEAEGGSYCLDDECDQRKLGWWAECTIGPNC